MSSRSTNLEPRRLRAVVHGRVQGVGFRYATQNQGMALRLDGSVRNLSDGTVEVIAEGPEMTLERLLDWLHEGPRMARVSHVETFWQMPTGNLPPFEVRF